MKPARPEPLIGVLLVLLLAAVVVVIVALASEPASIGEPGGSGDQRAPGKGATSAQVVHVSDGDTIVVSIAGRRERVRYIGIDAPEVAHRDDGSAAECWADEAARANEALVVGRQVTLEAEVSDRDRFGRLLRHVWVPAGEAWQLVGETLVANGDAEARSYPPDTARASDFEEVERRARSTRVGLWGNC